MLKTNRLTVKSTLRMDWNP